MSTDLMTKNKKELTDGVLFKDLISKFTLTEIGARDDVNETYMNNLSAKSKNKLLELEPKDSIQLMLSAQMLSVHGLQQKLTLYANQEKNIPYAQQYINLAMKLSNLFVNQATLLNKLQNRPLNENPVKGQSVHVHEGAQAVVGTVNCYGNQEATENEK